MTKKDYELIAATIASSVRLIDPIAYVDTPDGKAYATLEELACNFANALADANPRFNRDKFIKACGF